LAQIGLKNLYYAVMTIGTGGAETYATPKKIGNAVSVDISPSIQTTSLYGDDMAVATDVSLQEVRVTIETTDIPLEDQAALLGHTYNSTSGLSASMSDAAPYVGLLFESQNHDGSIRCVKLHKGKFAASNETINTKGENLDYQVPSLEGTFVAAANGVWKTVKDYAKGSSTNDWYASF